MLIRGTPETSDNHLGFWEQRLKGQEPGCVYLVQGRPGTPVKIGRALDPRKRLATLQTGNPDPLHILLVIPGGAEMERVLHLHLAQSRCGGEWFDGPEVAEFIDVFRDYAEQEKDRYWRTGELPRVPELPSHSQAKRRQRRGLVSQGGKSARMGHRWRTQDDEENRKAIETPVVIPPYSEPTEIQRKLGEAAKAGFSGWELRKLERELELDEHRRRRLAA